MPGWNKLECLTLPNITTLVQSFWVSKKPTRVEQVRVPESKVRLSMFDTVKRSSLLCQSVSYITKKFCKIRPLVKPNQNCHFRLVVCSEWQSMLSLSHTHTHIRTHTRSQTNIFYLNTHTHTQAKKVFDGKFNRDLQVVTCL